MTTSSSLALLHDLEAEEAVLGSILVGAGYFHRPCPHCSGPLSEPPAIEEVAAWLKPEDFHREKNRWIYETCLTLHQAGKPCNPIVVAHELARKKRLDAMGGTAYLGHLIAEVPTSLHIRYYAEIVKEYSERRELIARGQQMVVEGCNQTKPLSRRIDKSFPYET